jgi:hypothetical protein
MIASPEVPLADVQSFSQGRPAELAPPAGGTIVGERRRTRASGASAGAAAGGVEIVVMTAGMPPLSARQ